MKKYFLHSNGQHIGPYSAEDLRMMNISPSTPVWYEGLGSWKNADEIPGLNYLFTTSATTSSFHQPQFHPQFPATPYYSLADQPAGSDKKRSRRMILLITGGMLIVIGVICTFAYQKVKETRESMYERMRQRERQREKDEGVKRAEEALPFDYSTDGIETIEEAPQEIAPVQETFREEMPEFPGGKNALNAFIRNTIKYPEAAKKNGIQGTVYVRFTIEKNGEVTNPQIARGVSPELNAEAIRMVKKMPRWKSGTMNGHPVRITMTQPIRFSLQ